MIVFKDNLYFAIYAAIDLFRGTCLFFANQ